MLISNTAFGCVVWLNTYEQDDKAVLEELEKLRASKSVVVFCSGSEETLQLLLQAVKCSLRDI